MSVLDQIRKLDEQKAKLLGDAKAEALSKAEEAISALAELGFNYRLVKADGTAAASSGRRTGVRDDVLAVVKAHASGIARADVLESMSARGDKKAEQSVSNALANLKKAEKITLADGVYKAK